MAESNPVNPFASAMNQAKSAAEEVTKMFSDMKLPTIGAMPDTQALLDAHKRNLEAMSAANKVALEGAQAVAKRHMEILQQSMAEMTEAMRTLATAEAPQEKAAKQADLAKTSYERAVANMKELSDLIQKSNAEAVGVLNQRFTEAMQEIKGMVKK